DDDPKTEERPAPPSPCQEFHSSPLPSGRCRLENARAHGSITAGPTNLVDAERVVRKTRCRPGVARGLVPIVARGPALGRRGVVRYDVSNPVVTQDVGAQPSGPPSIPEVSLVSAAPLELVGAKELVCVQPFDQGTAAARQGRQGNARFGLHEDDVPGSGRS